jgi:lysozyme
VRYLSLLFLLLFPVRAVWTEQDALHLEEQVCGVDVSHHQKKIEWDTVAARREVHFAFVKATEGGDFTDSLFCHNWESLARTGMKRGAYHFFRAYGCGYDQAVHFLRTVEMQPGDLAPVLDIETTDGMSKEILLEEASNWLRTVEEHLGVKPIIYTNLHFYEDYLAGAFDKYPLWIARYSDERPALSNGKRWDIWQYSNCGCISGIEKEVDLNVFAGSPGLLDRLRWYPPAPEATVAMP